MNVLPHEFIARGWIDRDYMDLYAVGFDDLRRMVVDYPPERGAGIQRRAGG
ncbi:Nitrate reductase NarB [Gordonia terrae C-6]|uniref:Nitrate reductase NarB n=1 Tax=Gordonia terrae C-6 TaxID=1316928 RepID=R7Y5C6_9ACTN|nr:Nitrate reductase NarB [Gordonia terrae C-6]